MRDFIVSLVVLFFTTSFVFAEVEDTSIIDELNEDYIKELSIDFNLKSFESCQDMEDVMEGYIKNYWKNNKNNYYPIYRWIEPMIDWDMLFNSVDSSMEKGIVMDESVTSTQSDNVVWGWDEGDYSETNTQVKGVDESDIIKTDGDYIYYYNSTQKYVYIIDSSDKNNLEVVKKLKLPSYFSGPVLYISENRLIIVSTGYSRSTFTNYWINRNNKTYTVIFDTTDKTQVELLKIYVNDGNLTKSRKIGKYLYVVSNNYFNIPYHTFKEEADISVNIKNIVPKRIDISRTSDSDTHNLKLAGKVMPYHVTAWSVAKCNEIEYVLPDSETLKKYPFNPSYNIISIIDTEDTSLEVKTKVIAWSNSEMYMSLENLYLTSNMYIPYNYRCPVGARCIMPYYYGGTTNTLIHKLAIDENSLDYENSNIIPWRPLTQYSMDEKDDYFRIITSTNNWRGWSEKHTDLYILDKDLELYSSLENLWEWEDFKSSRFMWDKLYLVTFEQIDPLFAIDLTDQKNPEVLGELKIPGYSTYLHPYDDNHLIGLGYNTYENEWGSTRQWWIKVDLYEINFDKKCWDTDLSNEEQEKCDSWDYKWIIVKQAYSYTMWDSWSSSEALHNPRMFMWNANKNLLLLPATIYTNESEDSYKHIDFFNWLIALTINKDFGIAEKYKISHIDTEWLEEKRIEECKKYSQDEETNCRELLDGSTYCPPISKYVPEYCYANTPIGAYLASRSYNFRNSFIKRALWIGNTSFAISDDKVTSHDLSNGEKYGEVYMK